ncbi:MAG: hypothetical protein ACKO23_07855 [Gemmataceae bacterium]
MRRLRDFMGLAFCVFGVLVGCTATEKERIRPPKPPEEFNAPPENDPRYSGPIEYPRDVMDQDMLMKKSKEKSSPKNPLNSPRSAPGRMPGT